MANRSWVTFWLIIVFGLVLVPACSDDLNLRSDSVLLNQVGMLIWGGSPATDGLGIVFEVGEIMYGAPGTREDYSDYFPLDENDVMIRADIRITGETTMRGWGTRLPEIEFLQMERL